MIQDAARDGKGSPVAAGPESLQERLSWWRLRRGIDALAHLLTGREAPRPAPRDTRFGKLSADDYQKLSDALGLAARRAERSARPITVGRGLQGQTGIEARMGWRVAPYTITTPGREKTSIEVTTGNLTNHKNVTLIDPLRRRYLSLSLGEGRSDLRDERMWNGVPMLADRADYHHLRALRRKGQQIVFGAPTDAKGTLVPEGRGWYFKGTPESSGRVSMLWYHLDALRAAVKVRGSDRKTISARSPQRRARAGELVGVLTRTSDGTIKIYGRDAAKVHKVGTESVGKGYHLTLYKLAPDVKGSLTVNVTDAFSESPTEKPRVASRQWKLHVR